MNPKILHLWKFAGLGGAIGMLFFQPLSGSALGDENRQPPGIVSSEFIFQQAPFKECHASTIVETAQGLVAAWFGGTKEGHRDVGIWVSRKEAAGWSAPVEVANGAVSPEERYPCWNPVLHQPKNGPLMLFYKMSSKKPGPGPSHWLGMLMTSEDAGATWSKPQPLPEGVIGPVKNKPVELADGVLLCPSSSEHDGWRAL